MGGKDDVEYTIGYRYYMTVHMVVCHGNVRIVKTFCGDKEVFMGYTESPNIKVINEYNLFGGEDMEGGVQGQMHILTDGLTGDWIKYLEEVTKKKMPGYRGVTNVILGPQFMLCMVNPYPKPWRFCVHRSPIVPQMVSSIINITSQTVNPAAIIAECLLNQEWGLGVDENDIDFDSFHNAAGTLRAEGFGLAIRWDQSNTLEDFIGEICQIIDAQLSMDPVSGKFAIKLIRQDYNYNTLITLGPSDILELSDFSRPDPKDLINQVVIIFEDCTTGVQQSVTEQNTAALLLNPAVNSISLTYTGIPNQALARRVALRELAQYSSGLARCTIVANRKAANLKMGDCFKLDWPPLGFEGMVMRVTNFQQGMSSDWRVRLECVQDIYGLPDTVFDESESQTGWTGPDYTPVALNNAVIYEIPYYLVSYLVTGDRDSAWADLPEGFGYAAIVAAQPVSMAMAFEVYLQDYSLNNAWTVNRKLAFCDYGTLQADIDDTATSFTITAGTIFQVDLNEPALIDDEWVVVTAYNSSTGVISVGRGCMDTVPQNHSAGATIWLVGMYNNVINKQYVNSQTMGTILTTITPGGKTALGSSPSYTYTFRNRAGRPIPPANLRVNDVYRPKSLTSWAHTLKWNLRDRRETTRIWDDKAASFVPEEGTTYTIKIREKLFASSTWYDISTTTDLTDSPLILTGKYTPQAYSLEISAWAVLDNLQSLQTSIITFTHTPFVPTVLSMSDPNPSTSGRTAGDLFVLPANAGTNANWYKTWRNNAFVNTQPAVGDRISFSDKIFEFTQSGWNEV